MRILIPIAVLLPFLGFTAYAQQETGEEASSETAAIMKVGEGKISKAGEGKRQKAGKGKSVLAGVGERNGLWHTWTPTDGLAGYWVKDIYQDRKGYLWIATDAGVSRFDGEVSFV